MAKFAIKKEIIYLSHFLLLSDSGLNRFSDNGRWPKIDFQKCQLGNTALAFILTAQSFRLF